MGETTGGASSVISLPTGGGAGYLASIHYGGVTLGEQLRALIE